MWLFLCQKSYLLVGTSFGIVFLNMVVADIMKSRTPHKEISHGRVFTWDKKVGAALHRTCLTVFYLPLPLITYKFLSWPPLREFVMSSCNCITFILPWLCVWFFSWHGSVLCCTMERLELLDLQYLNSSTSPKLHESKWLFDPLGQGTPSWRQRTGAEKNQHLSPHVGHVWFCLDQKLHVNRPNRWQPTEMSAHFVSFHCRGDQ